MRVAFVMMLFFTFSSAASAQEFTFNPPGDLEQANRSGRVDNKVYVPDMRFPIEVAPAYSNSQVYGVGGSGGPAGGQCDERNYRYPWSDNYCESRQWTMPLCPTGNGHQGQDIRASTCVDNVHWSVAAEAGQITSIGSYSVYLVSDGGTQHRYLHMEPSSIQVSVGQQVSKGQRLGRVSNAFFSNGQRVPTTIHLHYDLNQNIPEAGGNVYVPTYMSLIRSYETLIGQEAEPCDVIPPEGGTVDDSGPCFVRHGNNDFWREVSGSGVGGSYIWTNAWDNATPGNWAQWFFYFEQTGNYRLEVKVNPPHNVSRFTRYNIVANAVSEEFIVDQSTSDDWIAIGDFVFVEGGDQRVEVYDNTGDTASDQNITVDAVRLTRLDTINNGDAGGFPDVGSGNENNTQTDTGSSQNPNNTNRPSGLTDPFLTSDPNDIRVNRGCCASVESKTSNFAFLLLGIFVMGWRRRRR